MTKQQRDTVPFSDVDEIKRKLGYETDADFSRHLGYSAGAFGEWRRSGRAPRVAYLAGCYLKERRRGDEAKGNTFVVAVDDKARADSLAAFLKVLGVPDGRVIRL